MVVTSNVNSNGNNPNNGSNGQKRQQKQISSGVTRKSQSLLITTDSNSNTSKITSSPTLTLSGMQNINNKKKINPSSSPMNSSLDNSIPASSGVSQKEMVSSSATSKPSLVSAIFSPRGDKLVLSTQSSISPILCSPSSGKHNNKTSIESNVRGNQAPSSSGGSVNATAGSNGRLCCDKCDGNHETDNCPYYKKKREDHPDAQKRSDKQIGGTSLLPGSHFALHEARVIRQPGDGSCLFHSMSYNLGQGYNASRLRSDICSFINHNPNLLISDTPLKDWVKWDTGTSVSDYVRKMSRGSWGGGIEMACLSQMKQVNVHVYERVSTGYKRISAFDYLPDAKSRPIIRVLYCGGVHYGKCIITLFHY
jgi:hypothetical protein